jgi:hypothetical protein
MARVAVVAISLQLIEATAARPISCGDDTVSS